MGIQTIWDNEEKTIIRHVYEGVWTWRDFNTNLSRSRAMLDTVNHPVHVIIDTRSGKLLPDGSVSNLRSMTSGIHPNQGRTILVGTNLFVSRLYNAFFLAYCDQGPSLALAPSLETARAMLSEHETRVPAWAIYAS
ncbi:MAG TPA: hypothetical protein VKQ72_13470 [Aggregatilineales bacterium]|nr:hypothetical protein [Aggregatilineales bacterium]